MNPSEMALYTTLRRCRKCGACASGYEKLLKSLPKGYGDNTPIPLSHVVKSNGAMDTVWALNTVLSRHRKRAMALAVTIASDCVEQYLAVLKRLNPDDDSPSRMIESSRTWMADLTGFITLPNNEAFNPANSAHLAAYASGSAGRAAAAASSNNFNRCILFVRYAVAYTRFDDANDIEAEQWQTERLLRLLMEDESACTKP